MRVKLFFLTHFPSYISIYNSDANFPCMMFASNEIMESLRRASICQRFNLGLDKTI